MRARLKDCRTCIAGSNIKLRSKRRPYSGFALVENCCEMEHVSFTTADTFNRRCTLMWPSKAWANLYMRVKEWSDKRLWQHAAQKTRTFSFSQKLRVGVENLSQTSDPGIISKASCWNLFTTWCDSHYSKVRQTYLALSIFDWEHFLDSSRNIWFRFPFFLQNLISFGFWVWLNPIFHFGLVSTFCESS